MSNQPPTDKAVEAELRQLAYKLRQIKIDPRGTMATTLGQWFEDEPRVLDQVMALIKSSNLALLDRLEKQGPKDHYINLSLAQPIGGSPNFGAQRENMGFNESNQKWRQTLTSIRKEISMAREIKFRAWIPNGIGGHMSEVEWIDFSRGLLFTGGVSNRELRDVELMQYTGLKDKNGVEIYEGDIIAPWSPLKGAPADVHYQGASFRVNDFVLDLPPFQGRNFEVIGNIYENPELLETKL